MTIEATLCDLQAGELYLCKLKNGNKRVLRWGFHRKNNDRNWTEPEGRGNPCANVSSMLWYGWRDHESLVFLRATEISAVLDVV